MFGCFALLRCEELCVAVSSLRLTVIVEQKRNDWIRRSKKKWRKARRRQQRQSKSKRKQGGARQPYLPTCAISLSEQRSKQSLMTSHTREKLQHLAVGLACTDTCLIKFRYDYHRPCIAHLSIIRAGLVYCTLVPACCCCTAGKEEMA